MTNLAAHVHVDVFIVDKDYFKVMKVEYDSLGKIIGKHALDKTGGWIRYGEGEHVPDACKHELQPGLFEVLNGLEKDSLRGPRPYSPPRQQLGTLS